MAILAPDNGQTTTYNPLLVSTQEQWRSTVGSLGVPGLTSLAHQALQGTWAAPFENLDPYPWASDAKLKLYSSSGDSLDQSQGMFGQNIWTLPGSSLLQSPTQPPPTNGGGATGGGGAPPPIITTPLPIPTSPTTTPSPAAAGGIGFLALMGVGVALLSGIRR